jgi:hypothetical protein
MDWNAQIGRDLKALDGIAAILLALAGLAERAAGAPLPVRWLVLWFLRQGEGVAMEFVAASTEGMARVTWSSDRTAMPHGSRPADAIHLALSLSRLACAVSVLAAQLRRQAFLRQQSGAKDLDRPIRRAAPGALGTAASRNWRPDTS